MSVHKHKTHTKSDRLIAAMEALTAQIVTLQTALTTVQAQVSDTDQQVALLSADFDTRVSSVIRDDILANGPISRTIVNDMNLLMASRRTNP